MITQRQALARVTGEWMQARAEDPKWKDDLYPLLVLMKRDKLTAWQAATKYAPEDPRGRTVRHLYREAHDVIGKVMDAFGETDGIDPVVTAMGDIAQKGEAWVLSVYMDRLGGVLRRRGIKYLTEPAQRVIRVDDKDPGDPRQ
jgi:hypothetical protein